jgi:hypothetical protein
MSPTVHRALSLACAPIASVLLWMGGPPVRAEPILRVQVAQIESSEPQVGRTSPKISSPNESRQHLIVTFPLATPDGVIAEVSRQHRMYAVHRIESKILDRLVVLFHVGQRSDMAALIAALAADPRVSDVQTDKLYEALLSRQPPASSAPSVPLPTRPVAKTRATGNRSVAIRSQKPLFERVRQRTAAAGEPEVSALRFPTADEPFVGPSPR